MQAQPGSTRPSQKRTDSGNMAGGSGAVSNSQRSMETRASGGSSKSAAYRRQNVGDSEQRPQEYLSLPDYISPGSSFPRSKRA